MQQSGSTSSPSGSTTSAPTSSSSTQRRFAMNATIPCDLAAGSATDFAVTVTPAPATDALVQEGIGTLNLIFRDYVLGDELGVRAAFGKLVDGVRDGTYRQIANTTTIDRVSCAYQRHRQDWTPDETRRRLIAGTGFGPNAPSTEVMTRLGRVSTQVLAHQAQRGCGCDDDLGRAACMVEISLFQEAAARAFTSWDKLLARRLAIELAIALEVLSLPEVTDVFGGDANLGLGTTIAAILGGQEPVAGLIWTQAGSDLLIALAGVGGRANVDLVLVADACIRLRVARGETVQIDTGRVPVAVR